MQVRALAVREMPNLKRALALTLAVGKAEMAVGFAGYLNYFLGNIFGRWRERDAVMESVASNQSIVISSGKLTKVEYLLESQRGEMLLSQGRAAEAERVFRALLARMDAGADYDSANDRCIILGQLGRSLRQQGKLGAAADVFTEALGVASKLEQTERVRQTTSILHQDLGTVLMQSARYDGARLHYGVALEMTNDVSDHRSAAYVLGNLGTIELMQGNLNESKQRYLEALVTFRNLGELQTVARTCYQLGLVATKAMDWDEAERCYKESLAIWERIGDKAGAVQIGNSLAVVAENMGRPDEAERWYRRAIELGEELGDRQALAKRYGNLAFLLLAQNRLDEAEAYAQRGREIDESLDLSVEPWKDYNILAEIAEKRGSTDEAQEWRRKAEKAKAAFDTQSGGQYQATRIAQAIQQWGPAIEAVVAACKGNEQARQGLEQWWPGQEKAYPSSHNLVAVIRRILAGERGAGLTEGLGAVDAAIVGKIVNGLKNG
jgi:tetratricopeptide (TPR) repeat protein